MEWVDMDENKCPCKGKGWAFRDVWVECPVHFVGQLHPQSRDLLLDDPFVLKEEERKSHLKWRISIHQVELDDVNARAAKLKNQIRLLESELISKTATTRMAAVNVKDLLQLHEIDSKWEK